MKTELTLEEKRELLRNNGWYQLWDEDNWLEKDRHYLNPDWAGLNTEKAYKKLAEELEYGKKDYSFS